MNGHPVAAIVIPVHATPPEFLREAIESVRAQRETRWELVISLDAATDACDEVARDMAASDPARISVVGDVGGTPQRASAARNRGAAGTRAPVLGFLDGDDVLDPDWLGERLALLEAHPEVAMVYGSSLYWYSWTGASRSNDFVPRLGVPPRAVQPPGSLIVPMLDGTASVPVPSSILVRRWAFDSIGGFDETSRELYEDQAFYASIGLRFPVIADDRVLDRYRQHPASMTARFAADSARQARWNHLVWLEREVERAGIRDHAIQRAIGRERWKMRHRVLAKVLRMVRRLVNGAHDASPARKRDTRSPHTEPRTPTT